MTIYFKDTSSFTWKDTSSFDWLSEDTATMNVLSASPVVDQLAVYLPGPVDVLSSIPIVDSLNASVLTPHQFTAKSVIFDFADNWSGDSADSLGIRSIEFYFVLNLIEFEYSNMYAFASSDDGGNYDATRAFFTYLDKDGAAYQLCWRTLSGAITNQRLIIVFDTPQTFDAIKVNNYHDAGADTDWGVKNTKIYISDETISNTNYQEDILDYTDIFIGEIAQHAASDVEDTETLSIDVLEEMYFITQAPILDSLIVKTMDISIGAPIVNSIIVNMNTKFDSIVTVSPVVGELEASMRLFTYSGLSLEIPIAFQMSAGDSIDIDFPFLSFSADMTAGNVCDISLALSPLDMLLQLGNNINTTLPKLLFSGSLVKEELVNMSGQFPALQMILNSSTVSAANFIGALKQFELALASSTGSAIDLSGTFPMLNLMLETLTGDVGNIEATWPMMQLNINSIITGDNDLELMFPELDLSLDSEKLACSILSHMKGAVR